MKFGQFGPPGPFPTGQFGPPGAGGQLPPQGPPGTQYGQFGQPGPTPGGSIRNNLGSGLKSAGVFQKDGHISNMRGGFLGPRQAQPYTGYPGGQFGPVSAPAGAGQAGPFQAGQAGVVDNGTGGGNMGKGPFSFLGSGGPGPGANGPRQLILQPAGDGIVGNGVATIAPDNSFFLLANLPPPHSFLGQGQVASTYAAYLVDKTGKNGFLAGTLRPMGGGVYQAQFSSNVPLTPYNRVVISVENPQYLAQAPQGPIVLKVKESAGPAAFLNPAKKAGGAVWNKIAGLFRGKPAAVPPVEPAAAGTAAGAAGAVAGVGPGVGAEAAAGVSGVGPGAGPVAGP